MGLLSVLDPGFAPVRTGPPSWDLLAEATVLGLIQALKVLIDTHMRSGAGLIIDRARDRVARSGHLAMFTTTTVVLVRLRPSARSGPARALIARGLSPSARPADAWRNGPRSLRRSSGPWAGVDWRDLAMSPRETEENSGRATAIRVRRRDPSPRTARIRPRNSCLRPVRWKGRRVARLRVERGDQLARNRKLFETPTTTARDDEPELNRTGGDGRPGGRGYRELPRSNPFLDRLGIAALLSRRSGGRAFPLRDPRRWPQCRPPSDFMICRSAKLGAAESMILGAFDGSARSHESSGPRTRDVDVLLASITQNRPAFTTKTPERSVESKSRNKTRSALK